MEKKDVYDNLDELYKEERGLDPAKFMIMAAKTLDRRLSQQIGEFTQKNSELNKQIISHLEDISKLIADSSTSSVITSSIPMIEEKLDGHYQFVEEKFGEIIEKLTGEIDSEKIESLKTEISDIKSFYDELSKNMQQLIQLSEGYSETLTEIRDKIRTLSETTQPLIDPKEIARTFAEELKPYFDEIKEQYTSLSEKINIPEPQEIDYQKIADAVFEKLRPKLNEIKEESKPKPAYPQKPKSVEPAPKSQKTITSQVEPPQSTGNVTSIYNGLNELSTIEPGIKYSDLATRIQNFMGQVTIPTITKELSPYTRKFGKLKGQISGNDLTEFKATIEKIKPQYKGK